MNEMKDINNFVFFKRSGAKKHQFFCLQRTAPLFLKSMF